MRDEFEKLVTSGKLNKANVEALVALTESGFCMHKSWGFGRITTVDTVFARFTIDFTGKAGHTMDLTFAATTLKAIPRNHILARKAADIENLRQMAALHHLDLIKLVLQSYDGRATIEQIQQVLVPDVIADDWKKWWDTARHELKKDGHFIVPAKKTDPIIYQVSEVALDTRLIAEFKAAKGLKNRIAATQEIERNLADIQSKAAVAGEVITALNAEIGMHQRTQPGVALEAIFARDDLAAAAGLPPAAGQIPSETIWKQDAIKINQVFEQIAGAKHRRALTSFKDTFPHTWHESLLTALNSMNTKLVTDCTHTIIHGGKLNDLKTLLARLISQHQASSDLLLWLAKERSDTFADILGPEVFRAMLSAMERDQFNEKRSNKLRDFILSDPTLLIELLESADLDVIKDVTRALQLSPCFDDMDKRSLLARIVKNYPAIQSMISGDQTKQDVTYVVSWESLERRKNEYTELVQKTIPANSKEIAIARSYGDLRENHEYKAAKEMQKILMRRKSELEANLMRARGTDFANARTDVVGIGSIVTVTDINANSQETFSVLGAWDSDPEKGVISYLTPVAQSLMNHKVGDQVEMEMDAVKKNYRIDSITAHVPAPSQMQTA